MSCIHTLERNRGICFQNSGVIKAGGVRLGGGSTAPVLAGTLHVDDDDTLLLRLVGHVLTAEARWSIELYWGTSLKIA